MTRQEQRERRQRLIDDIIANYPLQGGAAIAQRHGYKRHYVNQLARAYGVRRDEEALRQQWRQSMQHCTQCITTESHAKMGKVIRRIRRADKYRVLEGKEQVTKYPINFQTKETQRKRIIARYRLREKGYLVPRGSQTAYYTDDTLRDHAFEERYTQDYKITFTYQAQEQ